MSRHLEALPSHRPDGQDAELWHPSLGRWVRGFSVVGRDGDFLAVRRLADRALLPVLFVEADVRLVGADDRGLGGWGEGAHTGAGRPPPD